MCRQRAPAGRERSAPCLALGKVRSAGQEPKQNCGNKRLNASKNIAAANSSQGGLVLHTQGWQWMEHQQERGISIFQLHSTTRRRRSSSGPTQLTFHPAHSEPAPGFWTSVGMPIALPYPEASVCPSALPPLLQSFSHQASLA